MCTPFRSFAALMVCLASIGFHGAAQAQAGNLFEPALPADIAADARSVADSSMARQRLVRLNVASLDRAIEQADERPGAAPSQSLRIELFPDTVGTFERTAVEPAFGGGSVWTGRSADGAEDAATLVVEGQEITGQVRLGDRIYTIRPLGGGVHRVAEIAAGRLPPPGPIVRPPAGRTKASPAAPDAAEADGTTDIDVLFAYTKKSAGASSNIKSEINLAVSLSNEAYAGSKVQLRLKLVGTIQVSSYDEAKFSYAATLSNITGVSGSGSTSAGREAFEATRDKRDALGADLVVLVREGGEYCGIAWYIDKPTSSTSDYGFSEVSRNCISTYTAAHEIGHNMGLNHDRYVEPSAPASEYNFGYVNVGKGVQDIMAYDDKCRSAGKSCKQINKFSNPRIKVKEAPFGIPQGKSGAADASRRLNETRSGIAAYRKSKGDEKAEGADAAVAVDSPAFAASR